MRLVIISVFIIVVCCVLLSAYQEETANKEDAVTPVAAEMDNTVEEHLKLDEEYHAACEDLKRVLEKCDTVLGECLHTLEHHAVMLPEEKEKP